MNARAGSAYISSSGVAVIPSAASRGAPVNICARTRTNGAASAWSIALIERRDGQRLPQHLDQPRRLAEARQPGGDRLGRRRRRGTGLQGALRACAERQPIAPADAATSAATPAARCQGAGSRGQRSRDRVPCAIDERHVEAVLQRHAIAGADGVEEAEGLVVAAGEDVLAVVDAVAGLAIVECAWRARRGVRALRARARGARARPARTAARQAGEARADDDDVGRAVRPRALHRAAEAAADLARHLGEASLTRNIIRVQMRERRSRRGAAATRGPSRRTRRSRGARSRPGSPGRSRT